jgi:hypothetical protein
MLRSDVVRVAANDTLRDAAARRGIFVGSAVADDLISNPNKDPSYITVLQQQYDLYTAENAYVRTTLCILSMANRLLCSIARIAMLIADASLAQRSLKTTCSPTADATPFSIRCAYSYGHNLSVSFDMYPCVFEAAS